MHNGNNESSPADRPTGTTRTTRPAITPDERHRLKLELMQAEMRLAKARATATVAEVDIKVIHARLKALTP